MSPTRHGRDDERGAPAAPYADDLALALTLADEADAVTLGRFRAVNLLVRTKPDATPVTDADTGVETLVRGRLAAARPDDAVLGEEEGETAGNGPGGPRRWVLDPIDGTKNYARGVPVWATLLALEVDGVPVVGVVSAPALGRRWWASAGAGAFGLDLGQAPQVLRVSDVGRLTDASLSYSSLTGWERLGRLERFLSLARGVGRTRAYGDFWSHVLVAEGVVDVSTEPEVSRWDLSALDVVVREAGGRFTDLAGVPGPGGGSVVASNGRLHDEVLRALG